MSIAPNTPPASAGTRPRVPATTTARAGPMNAIHAMGDPVTASSGSNGWRYGSRPIPAATPATSPTAAKRSSTSGPAARARTSPSANTATAKTGALRRTANGCLPSAAAFSTPSVSRVSSTSSKVGTATIVMVPASPAPPRNRSERRGAAAGAKTNAKARANAAKRTSSADSGSIRRPHRKPSGARGDQRRSDIRPWALPRIAHAGDGSDCDREQSHGGQKDGALVTGKNPRAAKAHHCHDRKPQRRSRAGRHRKRDPEREQAGRDAEHESRRRTRRHELPTARTVGDPPHHHDRTAQGERAGVDQARTLENDERDTRCGERRSKGEASSTVGEDDQ